MKIKDLKLNPKNPRKITADRLNSLKKSIQDFEKMLELRPIIIDENNIVLGGNMRLLALKELKYKDIPDKWVKKVSDLSEEEKKQFIIKDNVGFGEWDFEQLVNDWNCEQLSEWGFNEKFPELNPKKKEVQELQYFKKNHILISVPLENYKNILKSLSQISEIKDVEITQTAN